MRLSPKILKLGDSEYREFVKQLPELAALSPDISRLNKTDSLATATGVACQLFSDAIGIVKTELADVKTGIVAVDIPESSEINADDNAFWGVVLATALGSNIFTLSNDKVNQTPFTVYAASYEKSRELTQFGLPTVAPETKLGFHTDGVMQNNGVSMPRNIMLYNVIIEYRRPGCFHWVPFDSWADKAMYMDRVGIGRRYSIRLTPSIYDLGNGQLEVASPDKVDAPIFPNDASNGYPLYINGTIVGSEDPASFDPSLFDALKQSIADNPIRYSVPQKSRRIIFARNIAGAHARDIFEDPIENTPYTRIFMRSVDADTISLS
jgi:hypothetical protein